MQEMQNSLVSDSYSATTMILNVLIFMLLHIAGAQDVCTIRQVSVQEGKSIIIPCWYNHIYINHVKYLSVGQFWTTSKCVVSSDGQVKHETFSVWDNKTVNILSVEMKSVLKSQTGKYWCGIELPGRDVKEGFNLKVTTGIPRLYVKNQMLTGFEAGSVNISCHHHVPTHGKMDEKWCRLGGDCMQGTSGTLDGASVKITHSSELMMVTMSKLKKENTGWYWCSVKEHQIPIYITVFKRRETITTTTTVKTTSKQPMSSSTVQFLGTFTPSQNPHHSETTSFLWLIIFGIHFVLIVILSCIAVYLCKKKQNLTTNTSLRKHQSKTESEEEQATAGDPEIVYATVEFIKP